MRCLYSVILASSLSILILWPLMPPSELHHSANTSLASNSSWLSPGAPRVADVGDGAEPDGVGGQPHRGLARRRCAPAGAGPHTGSVSVPNWPLAGAPLAGAEVFVAFPVPEVSTEPRLHAAATVIMTPAIATAMNRLRVRPTQLPPDRCATSPPATPGHLSPAGIGSLVLLGSESRTRSIIASSGLPVGTAVGSPPGTPTFGRIVPADAPRGGSGCRNGRVVVGSGSCRRRGGMYHLVHAVRR